MENKVNNLRMKIILLLNQFGINPKIFLNACKQAPVFIHNLMKFKKKYKGEMKFSPQLHDRTDEAGITKSEYFWQDLTVARWIYSANPHRHVDIGSRIDGFVAHVASFREIEVFDVRPISDSIPGVTFRQADITNKETLKSYYSDGGYCDSISCLHVLEHFGLGRYGDPINPKGYMDGFRNMARLLRSGGDFYLSTPIGRERVEFDANWVFDPRTIINLIEQSNLSLKSLAVFNSLSGSYFVSPSSEELKRLADQTYNLAIFSCKKN